MKRMFMAAALGLAVGLAGCDRAGGQKPSGATNQASGNPVTAPVDYLGAMGQAKKTAEKTIDLAALRQAIKLFQVQEGRYPRDLQELVNEKYLGALPPPPSGLQFKYNPATGEVSLVPK